MLLCLLSLLCDATGPAICCTQVRLPSDGYPRRFYSQFRRMSSQRASATQDHSLDYCSLTRSPGNFCALTSPIFCYEEAPAQRCTVIDGGVACDIALGLHRLMLLCARQLFRAPAMRRGAALPAGRGVRVMIAFRPWPALHYIHNETFASSTAASKW